MRTLLFMLQAAPSMANVNVVFGEEMIDSKDPAYPMVVIVPIGGEWLMPGYYLDANPDTNNQWATDENIDLYLAAESRDSAAEPVDHADTVYELRRNVMQAFQSQQPSGWLYRPLSGRWVLDQNAINRRGRAYVLSIQVNMTVADTAPVTVTVVEETINPEFA